MSVPSIPGRQTLLNEGHEKLAQFLARGESYKNAAIKAGYAPYPQSVHNIIRLNQDFRERLAYLRRTLPDLPPSERAKADIAEGKVIDPTIRTADDLGLTTLKTLADLDRLATAAEAEGQLNVAIKARIAISEITGQRKKVTESSYVGVKQRQAQADAKARADREAPAPAPTPQTPAPHLAALLAEEQRKQAEATARVKAREATAP